MRKEKISKRIRSLSFKMNILIVVIILSISVILVAASNRGFRQAVFISSKQRLDSIVIPQKEFAPFLEFILPRISSDEFGEVLEKSRSGDKADSMALWLGAIPSRTDGGTNMLSDWIGVCMEAEAIWESNDLKSIYVEVWKDQVSYRIFSKISNSDTSYAEEVNTQFGVPESYFPWASAEDYEPPVLTRSGDRDLYVRCARFQIDSGGEWRIWMTYDMTEAIREYRSFLVTSILMVLAVIPAAVIVSMLLMRRYVVRPISNLAGATRAFVPEADGTYSADRIIHVNSRSRNEIGDLSRDVQAMQERIVEDTENLTRMTADRERISTETDMAREIQRSMLPRGNPAFPERTEFDLYASIRPARLIGGDFYDYYFIDDDHLALVIGDVSGKGMPAALFMSLSKALIRNQMKSGCDPAQALTRINTQLYAQNEKTMFVTVWLAVLEISTGKGTVCNAGHQNPGIRRAGGNFELLHYKHDPVAGAIDPVRYHLREFELHPGDSLFVYSDGVISACDTENRRFGEKRLTETLNRDPGADPEELIRRVHEAIDGYAGTTPQFDDRMMLCFRYNGTPAAALQNGPGTDEITVPAAVDQVRAVTGFINEHLEELGCSERVRIQVDVAVDEIFSNIAHYAYSPETGQVTVRIETEADSRSVLMTFIDQGTPFNPLTAERPDTTGLPKEERPIGGLGLIMVKKIADDVSYEYRDGQNILTIRKRF